MSDQGVDRRLAWLTAGAAAALLVTAAAVVVPWDWTPDGTLPRVAPGEVLGPDALARAEAHADVVRPLSWSSYAVSVVLACLLGLTRRGRALVSPLVSRGPWWARVALVVLALTVVERLATSPFALLLRREALAVGLTEQSLGGWAADRALGALVTWATMTVIVLVLVGCARRWPRRWFLPAGAGLAAFTFGAVTVYPLAVEPLFNEFRPLPDGPFRTAVLRLADQEGVAVDRVLVSDASRRTTTYNAYVSGLGASRRIVVYDNLLAELPDDQALSVIAHELAHARHHDVVTGTTLAATALIGVTALLALALDAPRLRRSGVPPPGSAGVTPVLLALAALAGVAALPAQNAVSRAIEARADRTALTATDDPDAFVGLQRRLALRSLADPTPPTFARWLFGSHPTLLERVGLARAHAAQADPRRPGEEPR